MSNKCQRGKEQKYQNVDLGGPPGKCKINVRNVKHITTNVKTKPTMSSKCHFATPNRHFVYVFDIVDIGLTFSGGSEIDISGTPFDFL